MGNFGLLSGWRGSSGRVQVAAAGSVVVFALAACGANTATTGSPQREAEAVVGNYDGWDGTEASILAKQNSKPSFYAASGHNNVECFNGTTSAYTALVSQALPNATDKKWPLTLPTLKGSGKAVVRVAADTTGLRTPDNIRFFVPDDRVLPAGDGQTTTAPSGSLACFQENDPSTYVTVDPAATTDSAGAWSLTAKPALLVQQLGQPLKTSAAPTQIVLQANRNLCLGISNVDRSPAKPAQLLNCNNGVQQQWVLDPDGRIKEAAYTGWCLGQYGLKPTSESKIGGAECFGDSGLRWDLGTDGTIKVRTSESPSLCLDIDGQMREGVDGYGIKLRTCDASYSQRWMTPRADPEPITIPKFGPVTVKGSSYGDGTIRYTADTSKCIDLDNGNAVSGRKIQIWDCNGAQPQQWQLDAAGSLKYSANNGMCAVLKDNKTDSGTPVVLDTCRDSSRWTLLPQAGSTPDGTIHLVADRTKCLDLNSGNTSRGTLLWLYNCNGDNAQKWTVNNFLTADCGGVSDTSIACTVTKTATNLTDYAGAVGVDLWTLPVRVNVVNDSEQMLVISSKPVTTTAAAGASKATNLVAADTSSVVEINGKGDSVSSTSSGSLGFLRKFSIDKPADPTNPVVVKDPGFLLKLQVKVLDMQILPDESFQWTSTPAISAVKFCENNPDGAVPPEMNPASRILYLAACSTLALTFTPAAHTGPDPNAWTSPNTVSTTVGYQGVAMNINSASDRRAEAVGLCVGNQSNVGGNPTSLGPTGFLDLQVTITTDCAKSRDKYAWPLTPTSNELEPR